MLSKIGLLPVIVKLCNYSQTSTLSEALTDIKSFNNSSLQSSTSSTTGQEYMFSADNQDSDNQNYSQNNSNENPSHSISKSDSANQTDNDVCAECELDPGDNDNETGDDIILKSSHDKTQLTGTIIRKECRHSTKERSINHTRRKDLEHRQLGFPYSVIKCKWSMQFQTFLYSLCTFNVNWYIFFFCHFYKGKQLMLFPCCFHGQHWSSKVGSVH